MHSESTCVHSENGRFVVCTTAVLSARSAITGTGTLHRRPPGGTYPTSSITFLETETESYRFRRTLDRQKKGTKPTENEPWKRRPVESMESQSQPFHPSHRPWKSRKAARFPHSHRSGGGSLYPERKTKDVTSQSANNRLSLNGCAGMKTGGIHNHRAEISRSCRWPGADPHAGSTEQSQEGPLRRSGSRLSRRCRSASGKSARRADCAREAGEGRSRIEGQIAVR